MKRVFAAIAVLAVILAAAAAGLNMSPWLAPKLGFSPFQQATAERDLIPAKIAELIGSAQQSVIVATETFDSKIVLDALSDAAKRNLQIVVILSGPSNVVNSPGAAWLQKRGIPLRITRDAFSGLIIITDKEYAAICALPVVPTSRFAAGQTPLFVFHHKPTADNFFQRVRAWKFN